ncbi:MAG TPA: hypothetical protein PK264_10920, partial [Hyphomicrobiaceae bacterium]|nr:hypothetical protein [Hyphomicrobiaceae bacterium]
MGGKFELMKIARIPVLVDVTFIILIVLWGSGYLQAGNTQMLSAGVVVVIGLALSILIHEFAHAFSGRYFGTRVAAVELNGLGGLCYWASSLPRNAWSRIAISLAGPASNLALWFIFDQLFKLAAASTVRNPLLLHVLSMLSIANWYLFLFNMLPSFPLDGGRALEDFLGQYIGGYKATRFVASLGLLVAFGVGAWALMNNYGLWTL